MREIFVITEHGFDPSENELGSARYQKDVGFVELEDDARNIIEKMKKEDNKYRGWDGKTYPRYSYRKLELISEFYF